MSIPTDARGLTVTFFAPVSGRRGGGEERRSRANERRLWAQCRSVISWLQIKRATLAGGAQNPPESPLYAKLQLLWGRWAHRGLALGEECVYLLCSMCVCLCVYFWGGRRGVGTCIMSQGKDLALWKCHQNPRNKKTRRECEEVWWTDAYALGGAGFRDRGRQNRSLRVGDWEE